MSGTNRLILAQETIKAGKKGNAFKGYARRVTKANTEVTGKEKFPIKK